jgi:hypothetical protein
MIKRLIAIAFIFCCTAVAWAILGATIFSRTNDSRSRLKGHVVSTWGAPHEQQPPTAHYQQVVARTVETVENGKKIVRTTKQKVITQLPLESSRVQAALDLEHRQKGLLWYSTYKVAFAGVYAFRNASDKERAVTFKLDFPAERAIYDDLLFLVDDGPLPVTYQKAAATAIAAVGAGQTVRLRVAYRSQGLESWRYNFGSEVAQVRDFELEMSTNFKDVDFPESTLSPSEKRETANGWDLTWSYQEPDLRIPDRHDNAREAAAGAAGRSYQLFRAGVTVLLLLSDTDDQHTSMH